MNIFYSYDFEMELLELVERPSLSSHAKQLASIRRTGLGDVWIGDWGLGIGDSGFGMWAWKIGDSGTNTTERV